MDNVKLIKHLLEKIGIILPTELLNSKALEKIEKALLSGHPSIIAKCFESISSNIDRYIPDKDSLFKFLLDAKNYFIDTYGRLQISEDDKKMIEFLINNSSLECIDFIEMSGPMYFIAQTFDSIRKSKDLDEIILISIYMFLFVLLFELTIYHIDRRLYFYIKEKRNDQKKESAIKTFLEVDRKDFMSHATADKLNKVISHLLRIDEYNDTILGKTSKPKIFRNKISHFNIIYDSSSKEIIVGRERYSTADFIRNFYYLFEFNIAWIEKSVGLEIIEDNLEEIKQKVLESLKQLYKDVAKIFRKYSRSGELTRRLNSFLITLKKEAYSN